MTNPLSKLRLQSPLWQGIAALVSIAAIFISSFIAYDIYQKTNQFSDLAVEYGYSFDPLSFSENSSGQIAMSVNGEEITDARIYYYKLENAGNVPITPGDYIEPLKISVDKAFRILTVEQVSSNRDSIKAIWNKIDDSNYELKPLLLNPGDAFSVSAFISKKPEQAIKGETASSTEATEAEPETVTEGTAQNNERQEAEEEIIEPILTARIVNISDLRFTDYREIVDPDAEALGIFYTSLYHEGWSIYRLAILIFVLFIFGLFLGVKSGSIQENKPYYYVLLSTLMGLSVVSGDNIASRINGFNKQPWMSNFSLALYFVLTGFFTLSIAIKLFQGKNSVNDK